jgi:hypothetical protein
MLFLKYAPVFGRLSVLSHIKYAPAIVYAFIILH